jgi:serine/threonine-protein kinase
MSADADCNLLFGVLAIQLDFINRDALLRAMNAWVLEKDKPLGQVLVEQQALAPDRRALLEALVQEHLKAHQGDPAQSLASVSSIGSLRDDLKEIADSDLGASLDRVSVRRTPVRDAAATGEYVSAGTPTSSGLRFTILRPHARGGLGEVFVARDEELHREVALKQIQDRYAADSRSRGRFLLEAEVTGGLEHPGIVPVYGLGTYGDGRPYYAMRFVRGDTLQDAIDRYHRAGSHDSDPGSRSLDFRKLLGRFVDVCQAVAYAHSRGVLHRDLKPDNVMVGKYGETLVVDWGLAKPVGRTEGAERPEEGTIQPFSRDEYEATQMGSAVGTPAFMSPEAAARRVDQLGPAADVYGLGATLYYLLTGRLPLAGDDLGQVLQRVQRGDFPPPRAINRSVPLALDAVCRKAMSLQPQDRYASVRALADDVEHWLADEPVSAWPEPWTVRARRWVGRHRMAVTAAAAGVLVAVVCLGSATGLLAAANRRERQERERADQNLARARDAVDRYCTHVAEDPRLRQQDLHALRKQLLETAVPFYEDFAHQHGEDPALLADRGRALLRLGRLRGELGEQKRALDDCGAGAELFARLAEAHPEEPGHRADLAECCRVRGIWLHDLGRLEEARAEFHRAIGIMEPLAAAFPTVTLYRWGLARCRNSLAGTLDLLGQPEEALTEYRKSIGLVEPLATAFAAVSAYRGELGLARMNLGYLLTKLGRSGPAQTEYQRAIALQEQLAVDFPTNPEWRWNLAQTRYNLGILMSGLARSEEARGEFQKAMDLLEGLGKTFPAVPNYRYQLASNHIDLGNVLDDLGRKEEALAEYRKAISLLEPLVTSFPAVARYRRDLANAHYNLADALADQALLKEALTEYQKARDLAEQLTAAFPADPEYRWRLAVDLLGVGGVMRSLGRREEAEAEYRRATAVNEQLVEKCPQIPNYAAWLARSWACLGQLELDGGRPATALALYDKASARLRAVLVQQPGMALAQDEMKETTAGKALALARLGRHAEALALAGPLAQDKDLSADGPYLAACALAACSAGKPNELASAAVVLLRKAHARGYFKHPENLRHLKTDGDLTSLRNRDDFKKLLAEVESKAPPKGK